jgi:hypothetical protein
MGYEVNGVEGAMQRPPKREKYSRCPITKSRKVTVGSRTYHKGSHSIIVDIDLERIVM